MTHQIVDPAPFLSTVAATSAGLVAIVGGLLVARFVTIGSEQEGAQQLVDDAEQRLAIAQRRKDDADHSLYEWDKREFFDTQVIRAICSGERDFNSLRELGGSTSLSNNQIAVTVLEIAEQYELAKRLLEPLGRENLSQYRNWNELGRKGILTVETNWNDAWKIAFNELARSPRSTSASSPLYVQSSLLQMTADPAFIKLSEERRDQLWADAERRAQQVEDLEAEASRLRQRRAAIVRPRGLGLGLTVLGYFAIVGIIVPMWLMSRATNRLTDRLGETVFWLFLSGLIALLAYMTTLALRLSSRRLKSSESRSNDDDVRNSPVTFPRAKLQVGSSDGDL